MNPQDLLAGRRLALFAKPSLLGEAVCAAYEEEIGGEAGEAHARVLLQLYPQGGDGPNSLLSSLSFTLFNGLSEGKAGVTTFGFNTPSPDDAVQNARTGSSDLFAKSLVAKVSQSSPSPSRDASPSRSQLTASLSAGGR